MNKFDQNMELALTLPDGTKLLASAAEDESYPAINVDFISKDGKEKERMCFVEYNPERENGPEVCIGVYNDTDEETVFYDSYQKSKQQNLLLQNSRKEVTMKNTLPSLKLNWGQIAYYAQRLISDIIARPVHIECNAADDFWDFAVVGERFITEEILELLRYVKASDSVIADAMPEDMRKSRSLGMELSRELLKKILKCTWEAENVSEHELWLLNISGDYTGLPEIDEGICFIGKTVIDRNKLWSSSELTKKLTSAGATYTELTELCGRYVEDFGNELKWHYMCTESEFSGTLFVVVKEGVLCLPYSEVDTQGEIHFNMESARLCNSDSMGYYINAFDHYASYLFKTMGELKKFIKETEAKQHE